MLLNFRAGKRRRHRDLPDRRGPDRRHGAPAACVDRHAVVLQGLRIVHIFRQAQKGGLDRVDRRAAAYGYDDIGAGPADRGGAVDDGVDGRMFPAAGEDADNGLAQFGFDGGDQIRPGGDGRRGHDQRPPRAGCRHFPPDRRGRRRTPGDALLGEELKQAFHRRHGYPRISRGSSSSVAARSPRRFWMTSPS